MSGCQHGRVSTEDAPRPWRHLRRQLRRQVARSSVLEETIRRIRRTTAVMALQSENARLREALAGGEASDADPGTVTLAVPASASAFLVDPPAGHFYSPVPDMHDVEAQADRLFGPRHALPGVDLRIDAQLARFRTLAALAREAPLERVPGAVTRYGLDNPNYGVGDASMLHATLRHLRPRRYFEVGSGYTTALAVDVNERYLTKAMTVTAVEPYPALLQSVLRPGDEVEVIAEPVQSVPVERFTTLEDGDVLFIDSSHVLKTGSDVQYLYGEVLPSLSPGVHVHVHDIFWPFEYLPHWVRAGRAWNEAYLLRAFLTHNASFEITLWNHYLAVEHRDVIARELPAMLATTGGAMWMRRRPGQPAADRVGAGPGREA